MVFLSVDKGNVFDSHEWPLFNLGKLINILETFGNNRPANIVFDDSTILTPPPFF